MVNIYDYYVISIGMGKGDKTVVEKKVNEQLPKLSVAAGLSLNVNVVRKSILKRFQENNYQLPAKKDKDEKEKETHEPLIKNSQVAIAAVFEKLATEIVGMVLRRAPEKERDGLRKIDDAHFRDAVLNDPDLKRYFGLKYQNDYSSERSYISLLPVPYADVNRFLEKLLKAEDAMIKDTESKVRGNHFLAFLMSEVYNDILAISHRLMVFKSTRGFTAYTVATALKFMFRDCPLRTRLIEEIARVEQAVKNVKDEESEGDKNDDDDESSSNKKKGKSAEKPVPQKGGKSKEKDKVKNKGKAAKGHDSDDDDDGDSDD